MKIAILCSGLGNIKRGHETFVRDVFDLLKDKIDMTLFKGGGEESKNEIVIQNIPRESKLLNQFKKNLICSNKWKNSIDEEERTKLEMKTFAYNALPKIIEGEFDIIHCPDSFVIDILYKNKSFFKKIPKFIYANGGSIKPEKYPDFDFIQHHSLFSYSISQNFKKRSFIVPYFVDTRKFNPNKNINKINEFRKRINIPKDAFVIVSVGTICDNHKRMSYLIKEISKIKNENVHLLIAGQESNETSKIKKMGKLLLKEKIHFISLDHKDIPLVYQASDLFILCSLFEGFGIVYLEAMASGIPILATNHKNQQWIMGNSAILINMKKPNLLAKKIDFIIDNVDVRNKMIIKGFNKVQDFSKKNVERKYFEMYNQVMEFKLKTKKYGIFEKIKNNLINIIK